jgi:CBS domain containing-hemolysin-like protein
MVFDIFLTLFMVFLNGFFVAAEFAIVKVRSSQISLQSSGLAKKAASKIIGNLDGFLAATQLGITLASLGLGWIGEDVVSQIILSAVHGLGFEMTDEMAHRIAIPVAFTTITVLHIVFGELAPKSLAIRYPTTTTLALAVPLRIFYLFFRPFIWVLNGIANFILRLFGIKPVGEHEIHSEEELKLIIAESEEGGAIEASERELIQNVFDFDNRIVRQVMIPRMRIIGVPVETTMEEAMNIVLREGFSRYPVYKGSTDDILGVVHSKDIVTNFVTKSGKALTDIMRPPYFITETKPIDELLREFQKKRNQMAIVISEFGGTLGIVTLEDILEELVGEIQDEHDHEVLVVTPIGPEAYRVIAQSPLHDINKMIDHPFPESEDYETLSGLIVFHKPAGLRVGEELTIGSWKIRIVKMYKTLPEIVEIAFTGVKEEEER